MSLKSAGGGGTGGSGTVQSVNVSGGTTGLTTSGGPVTGTGTISLAGILNVASGGTGTSSPALAAGANIGITGSWPNQTVAFSGTLPVANGGTGTTTPGIVAGTNVSVTGTWPNQTINASGAGGAAWGSITGTLSSQTDLAKQINIDPVAMGANVIDITNSRNTKASVALPQTYTFSATPATAGQCFGFRITVTTAGLATFPSFYSDLTQTTRTTVFLPIGEWTLEFEYDGAELVLYNEPGPVNNLAATVDPTVSNDGTQGYVVGSLWLNTTSNRCFICMGNSTGAAIWDLFFGWYGVTALTFASTVAVNAALVNTSLAMTGAAALGVPTNPVDGQVMNMYVTQDATGSRVLNLTTAGCYVAGGGIASIVLSTAANAVDLLSFQYRSSTSKWTVGITKAIA